MATSKKKNGRLEIGELYQWQPKNRDSDYKLTTLYTMYLGDKHNLFTPGFEDYFGMDEAIVPFEVYRGRGNGDTQYRILTTSGKIGWISIDDSFVDDWNKVTKPL
jgi:hypothetical protein